MLDCRTPKGVLFRWRTNISYENVPNCSVNAFNEFLINF